MKGHGSYQGLMMNFFVFDFGSLASRVGSKWIALVPSCTCYFASTLKRLLVQDLPK